MDLIVGISANAVMTTLVTLAPEELQGNTSSTAVAYVDTDIAVADKLIPGGGSATYRDYFAMQFSSGYWALGQTPARPITWGDLKQRYLH